MTNTGTRRLAASLRTVRNDGMTLSAAESEALARLLETDDDEQSFEPVRSRPARHHGPLRGLGAL